jgi:integrase
MVIDNYITPHLGSKRLVDLSPMHIKPWHALLLDHGAKSGKPLSTRSVQLAHRILHRALADAVRWNLIAVNPVSGVRAPRAGSPEMQAWSADEAVAFLRAIADERLAALWTVALHTGLRRGKRQRLERIAAGPAWTDTGYVFIDEFGQPYHPQSIYSMFVRACSRADVPPIRLHDLRHTMATLALQAGVHPKIVQEQLGHSAINVTLDIYSHVPQVVRREAAGQIAALFEG